MNSKSFQHLLPPFFFWVHVLDGSPLGSFFQGGPTRSPSLPTYSVLSTGGPSQKGDHSFSVLFSDAGQVLENRLHFPQGALTTSMLGRPGGHGAQSGGGGRFV